MSIHEMPKTTKLSMPQDGKTKLGYAFWNMVNELIVVCRFRKFEVSGLENIPVNGPFLLIANHSKRWDGPVVQYLLDRRANYMVSPNEMRGLQGAAVMSVGAFPANPRLNPVGYALNQLRQGEPVVVFPEGNVFYDGAIHPFKPGVSKIALNALTSGHPVPVIPMHISYSDDKAQSVKLTVGKPVVLDEYVALLEGNERGAQCALSYRLYEEVVALRDGKQSKHSEEARTFDAAEEELQCSA